MEIHASTLAAPIDNIKNWLNNLIEQKIDAFHVDLVDPSFADYIAPDFQLIEQISKCGTPFWVHYMATWNKNLIIKILELKPAGIYFHQEHILDLEFFKNINASIAIKLGETVKIDASNYLFMNVNLGYCGQKFDPSNINAAKKLKHLEKTIATDGGINLETIQHTKNFDHIIIGSALKTHSVMDFKNVIQN